MQTIPPNTIHLRNWSFPHEFNIIIYYSFTDSDARIVYSIQFIPFKFFVIYKNVHFVPVLSSVWKMIMFSTDW